MSSIGRLHNEFQSALGNTASTRAVPLKLHKLGFYGWAAAYKLSIAKINASQLKWCKEGHHWTPEQWRYVQWSDGLGFTIWQSDGMIWIWRMPDECHLFECTNCKVCWRRHHDVGLFWSGPLVPV